jgi:hypothetical protein
MRFSRLVSRASFATTFSTIKHHIPASKPCLPVDEVLLDSELNAWSTASLQEYTSVWGSLLCKPRVPEDAGDVRVHH